MTTLSLPILSAVPSKHPWLIVDDLYDPATGLSPHELTDSLEPLGLPPGWGDESAAAYALAAHAHLSFEVGARATMRANFARRVENLVGAVLTEIPGLPVPFRDFAGPYHVHRYDASWGWGNGPNGLKRLFQLSEERGGLRPVADCLGLSGWSLKDARDYQALDTAWTHAEFAGVGTPSITTGAIVPLLPVEVVSCFAPARRRVVVPGVDEPVEAPSLFELMAVAVFLGPANLRLRMERFLSLQTTREIRKRRDRNSRAVGVSGTTLSLMLGSFNGFLKYAGETLAPGIPELTDQWKAPGRLALKRGLTRNTMTRTTIRTAVPLAELRRSRLEQYRSVVRTRKKSKRRASTKSARGRLAFSTALRRLLWIDLLAQVGCRPNEMLAWREKDYDPEHAFLIDGYSYIRPAVYLVPSQKDDGGLGIDPYWRPITAETAALLEEWIEWLQLEEDDYLFPRGGSALPWSPDEMSRDFTRAGVILMPGDDQGYAPTRIRHLGHTLGLDVGFRWLQDKPSQRHLISAQVFADAHLTHVMSQDHLGYADLNANREKYGFLVTVGDPRTGAPGVVDHLYGETGARRAWDGSKAQDLSRTREAGQRTLAEQKRVFESNEETAIKLRERLSALNKSTPSDDDDGRAWRRFTQHGAQIRDEIEAATARARQAERKIAEAESQIRAADDGFKDLRKDGPSLCLPDDAPLRHELPQGETPLDEETWEDTLQRIEVVRGSVTGSVKADVPTVSPRVREHTNIQEMAAICGVSDRAVRGWIDLDNDVEAPFSIEGPSSAVLRLSARQRVINVNRLPKELVDRLTASQRELMEQILMERMGETRWGGAEIEDEVLEALEACRGRRATDP